MVEHSVSMLLVICNIFVFVLTQQEPVQMNILRLVVADKERKAKSPNPEFQKIEAAAACSDKGDLPIQYDKDELRKKLSPVEYFVTQEKGTER